MSPIELRLILSLLTPVAAVGCSKVRLGDDGDGGYVLLDRLAPAGVCLSLGVGHDVSFDMTLAQLGYDVFQFDHTVEGPALSHERFYLNRIGISDQASPPDGFLSIADILAVYDLRQRDDLILKMDIEGAEWGDIPLISLEDLDHFDQICIEFHQLGQLNRPAFAEMASVVFHHFRETHVAVHVHGNNNRPIYNVLGVPVPDFLEITLARRRSHGFLTSTEFFPTPSIIPTGPRCLICFWEASGFSEGRQMGRQCSWRNIGDGTRRPRWPSRIPPRFERVRQFPAVVARMKGLHLGAVGDRSGRKCRAYSGILEWR